MTDLTSLPQSEQKKLAAWTACKPLQGFPEAEYRIDAYGNLIVWSHYGTQGDHGWEIDHRHPSALGGSDDHGNLRALQWRKNRELGGVLAAAIRSMSEPAKPTAPNLFATNALEGLGGPATMTGRNAFGFGRR